MAVIDQHPTEAAPDSRTDIESSALPKGLLANIVDVLEDSIPNLQPPNQQLELRDPTSYQTEGAKRPKLPVPGRSPHHPHFRTMQNGPVAPLHHPRTRFPPWHQPFQAPFRPSSQPQQQMPSYVPPYSVFPNPTPPQRERQLQAGEESSTRHVPSDSNYSRMTCESPIFEGKLECDATEIVNSTSFASHEADNSCESTLPRANGMPPLTPKRIGTKGRRDMEGKRLATAVSESPTDTQRELASIDKEMPQIPDSPGPAFFSFMSEMDGSDELKIEEGCFEAQVESVGDFDLLPCLDDEEGKARVSPPIMPFLSQSPQLSWEVEDSKKLKDLPRCPPINPNGGVPPNDPKSNKLQLQRKRSLTLRPKSDLITFADQHDHTPNNGPAATLCQPLFQEQALCFEHGKPDNLLQLNDGDSGAPTTPATACGFPAPMMPMPPGISRDDLESNRVGELEARRDNPHSAGIFSKRRSPPQTQQQQLSRGSFPTISQSFSYSPVPPPRAMMALPSQRFTPPRPPVGHMGFAARSGGSVESPRFPLFMQESKGRCAALSHPVPSKFQGDMEKAMNEPLPDFSSLVNYPNSLRQNRALPNGMRCCVMCGTIRPTCSRSRNRGKTGGAPMTQPSFGGGVMDDFVTIPTQNKGLCTMCDISVWVVRDSGCQIKWCKGCKNFRQWAFFGEKGLATKCGRCRERQREKYAKMKDSKRREAEKRRHNLK